MKKNRNLPQMRPTRKKKQETTPPVVTTDEMKKLIKIIGVVTVIFLAVYGFTILIKGEKKTKPEEVEVEIQNEDILLGNLLEQSSNNYFVLVIEDDDDYKELYKTYFDQIKKMEKGPTVYTSNLSNSFNLKYKGAVTVTTNIKELKLKGSALLHIYDKKIGEVYEGKDAIVAQLKKMKSTD